MKTTTAILSTALFIATASAANAPILAQRAPVLDPRAVAPDFYGGWPLVADSCPSGTDPCSKNAQGGSCCPTGTTCVTNSMEGEPVCCPQGKDCARSAGAAPVCSDPSWTLYIGYNHYFCCGKEEIGTFNPEGTFGPSPVCLGKNVPVPASELATKYTTKGGAVTATRTISSTAGRATATVTDESEPTDVTETTSVQSVPTSSATGVTRSNDAGRVGGGAFMGLGALFVGAAFVL